MAPLINPGPTPKGCSFSKQVFAFCGWVKTWRRGSALFAGSMAALRSHTSGFRNSSLTISIPKLSKDWRYILLRMSSSNTWDFPQEIALTVGEWNADLWNEPGPPTDSCKQHWTILRPSWRWSRNNVFRKSLLFLILPQSLLSVPLRWCYHF